MTRIIEADSEAKVANIEDNAVFMMFVLQPSPESIDDPRPEPQWGIMKLGVNGKYYAQIGTAPTQRAAFDGLLTMLNLSTDKNFVLPFTPTDELEKP